MSLPLCYLNQLHPIIYCPIVHILNREKHISLFVRGHEKNPASNKAVDISNARHCDDMTKEECKRFVLMVCVRKKY
jgi:hypothetical protein